MDQIGRRKDEHVKLAEKLYQESSPNDFDAIRFVHHSLPQIKQSEVQLGTSFSKLHLETPFFINGMTGGSTKTAAINRDLAIVARETNLAMATGSINAAIKNEQVKPSFQIIRKMNPKGVVFANLGAEHSLENAKIAVELLQAQALQIHVNAPQELLMAEGERDFSHWLENIEKIVAHVGVPVIVKEVGFGMSRETIQQLKNIGVQTIDVSGRGGTNFAAIENERRADQNYSFVQEWGQSTAISLLEAASYKNQLEILASGGIKSPMDMIKAYALGAKAVGLSGQFLHLILSRGVNETIKEVESWKESLKTLLTLLGRKNISELEYTDLVFYDPLVTWCQARKIDWHFYAERSALKKTDKQVKRNVAEK